MKKTDRIKVSVMVDAPLETVWAYWVTPKHITKWNQASPDWHTPRATNDFKEGGHFNYRMEAKDGSVGFDFTGMYTEIKEKERIAYTLDDGRGVRVTFMPKDDGVLVEETFDPENENSKDLQRAGWQAILDTFKFYVERHS
ncbi:SRPBCC family protein [Altibacter sp.]|uniref:SRPBCC family protein n=1 Tax=Altibacter sp. TaxID=2024823 RepID=UPI00258CA443|nr:SRPBCC family protein [Altibacter sp.]MCW8980806.1 SRPBCC family protein [Altibacter sp.]MCW9038660.1 SRPBCC family protein [Altibacter sp.]